MLWEMEAEKPFGKEAGGGEELAMQGAGSFADLHSSLQLWASQAFYVALFIIRDTWGDVFIWYTQVQYAHVDLLFLKILFISNKLRIC